MKLLLKIGNKNFINLQTVFVISLRYIVSQDVPLRRALRRFASCVRAFCVVCVVLHRLRCSASCAASFALRFASFALFCVVLRRALRRASCVVRRALRRALRRASCVRRALCTAHACGCVYKNLHFILSPSYSLDIHSIHNGFAQV